MPTLWAHEQYWVSQSTVVIPPSTVVGGVGSYSAWQRTVIMPSLFGAFQEWWERWAARLRWWRDVTLRIERLGPDRRALLTRTIEVLDSPGYPLAQQAVRQTATTLGFNRPEAQKPLWHMMKSSPGQAENVFRHLNVVELVDAGIRAQGSTLSNPQKHFLAELAYQDFALRGR